MSNEVFNDICESTLIGYKSQMKVYDAREIADLIFLYFVSLQILKSSFISAPFAIDYANQTNKSNIDVFSRSGTDLNILMHTLFGQYNQSTLELLNNQKANDIFLNRLSFTYSSARNWLMNMKTVNSSSDSQFLLRLESALQISNSSYKSIRRLASDWSKLDQTAREVAMTRLLQAFRAKASKSELVPALVKLARHEKLVIKDAYDSELKSTPKTSLLKAATIGSVATAGVAAYAIHRLLKNLGEPNKRK